MNPITWLRWRARVPTLNGGPIAQLAEFTAWHETKDADAWPRLLPSLELRAHPDRRLRLWVVKAALWQHARMTRHVGGDLLGEFFAAFWPVFLREVKASAPLPVTAEQFLQLVLELLPTIAKPRGVEGRPDKRPWFLAKEVWSYISGREPAEELPEIVALLTHVSFHLVACAQLLEKLPSIAREHHASGGLTSA
jgi:hypothetical protein